MVVIFVKINNLRVGWKVLIIGSCQRELIGQKISNRKKHNEDNGLFLSNVTASKDYEVSKLNYLIEAPPAELHIIEMLWCLVVGPALEQNLSKDCYGNRLSDAAIAFNDGFTFGPESTKSEVFKRYFDQYSTWRDKALDCATEILKLRENTAFYHLILSLTFMK